MAGKIVVQGTKRSKTVPGRVESFYVSVPQVRSHETINNLMTDLENFFDGTLEDALSYSIVYHKID